MSESSSNKNNNKVFLKSCDGEIFEVDVVVASESLTIRDMIQFNHFIEDVDGMSSDSDMPLANANGMSSDTDMPLANANGKSDDSAMPLANITGKSDDSAMPKPNGKSADRAFIIRTVTGETFAKIIEYCMKHVLASNSDDPLPTAVDDELKAFDVEFLKLDQKMLFDLILAADYLNIKGLLDLTCKYVADRLYGRTPEQIRAEFNIVNDYTAEEEEQIRREIAWAFTREAPLTFR